MKINFLVIILKLVFNLQHTGNTHFMTITFMVIIGCISKVLTCARFEEMIGAVVMVGKKIMEHINHQGDS